MEENSLLCGGLFRKWRKARLERMFPGGYRCLAERGGSEPPIEVLAPIPVYLTAAFSHLAISPEFLRLQVLYQCMGICKSLLQHHFLCPRHEGQSLRLHIFGLANQDQVLPAS